MVSRRKVFYVPGFDPRPPGRYRALYAREGARQARICGYTLKVTGLKEPEAAWRVAAEMDGRVAVTEMRVVDWSDLARARVRTSPGAVYRQLAVTLWRYLGSGAILRCYRLRKAPVLGGVWPVAALLAQLALALAAGAAVGLLAGGWLGLGLAAAVAWGGLVLWRRADRWLFADYLLGNFAFAIEGGGDLPADAAARLDAWADRIAGSMDTADEVLIVGHSFGCTMAVWLADRLLARGAGDKLALLTLGQSIPIVSFLPGAGAFRAALGRVSAGVTWVDVTSPVDGVAFALTDPVATAGAAVEGTRGPLVLSAAFRNTLSAAAFREIRGRWFRIHFQYLCAFDRPGHYDYFRLTAGPVSLADGYAGRAPSPKRDARVMV